MKEHERRERYAAENAAYDAMDAMDPDASDEIIAGLVADYLVTQLPNSRTCHLSVLHDMRPSALRNLERIRKYNPDYDPGPVGPFPLPYDWTYKNVVGVSTRDRDRARQWAIDAMLAGYSVFRSFGRHGSAGGRGTLAQIRAHRRDEIMRETRKTA